MQTTLNAHRKADDTILLALLVVLVALTPLLHLPGLRNPDLPRYPLLAAVAGFGLLILALDLWHGRRTLQWHSLLSLAGALFAWALLSSAWTEDPANNAIEVTQLTGLVLLALLAAQVGGEKNSRLLLSVATAGASLAALLGLWQNYGFNPLGLRAAGLMASTFYLKNHAAMYFDFILPPAFILVLLAQTRTAQWLAGLGLALCGAYVLCIRTRGSWLGLGVAAVALLLAAWRILPPGWFWGRVRERKAPLLCAAIFSLTLFLLPSQIGTNLRRDVAPDQVLDKSSMIRLQLYQNALPMIADHPLLGVGLGAFRQAFRPYMYRRAMISNNQEDMYVDRLHNDPLQIVVELGLVGGLLAGACYFAALGQGIGLMRQGREQPLGLLALALTLGLVANGIHSFFDFPYHKPASAIHFWLSLGLLAGLSISASGTRAVMMKRVYSGLAVAMAFIFLAHNTNFYLRYLCDNYHTTLAEDSHRARDCDSAIYYIDKAVQEFGNYWATHAARIKIYTDCEADPERRLQAMNEELLYEPANPRALLTRANIYRTCGFADLARNDYNQVAGMYPNRASAFLGLARLALAENRPDDALVLLDRALQNEPQHRAALALRNEITKKP